MPCQNISKVSRLTSVEEKNEWVENIMPPGARTKFEVYKDVELGSQLDHNIYEVIIMLVKIFGKIYIVIYIYERYWTDLFLWLTKNFRA